MITQVLVIVLDSLNSFNSLSLRFVSGALGPGTIVGSAAYNLFIISAVCVVGIPNNESRTIRAFKVTFISMIISIISELTLISYNG